MGEDAKVVAFWASYFVIAFITLGVVAKWTGEPFSSFILGVFWPVFWPAYLGWWLA